MMVISSDCAIEDWLERDIGPLTKHPLDILVVESL